MIITELSAAFRNYSDVFYSAYRNPVIPAKAGIQNL
jgi:hypothetical protein